MTKDEALKMVIENLELQEFNTVNATLISYCKEALEQNDNLLTIAYMSGVAEGKSKALEQPAQSTNEHSDEFAEVLIALKEWVISAEKRLAKLEQALKEKNS
jgi:hypothetical protein